MAKHHAVLEVLEVGASVHEERTQFTHRDRTAGGEGFSILGEGDHSSPTERRQLFLNISFSRSGFVNVIQRVTATVTEKTKTDKQKTPRRL